MARNRTALTALLAAAALTLTGCGGETPSEPDPAGTTAASNDAVDAAESDAPTPVGDELIGMVGTADDPEAYEIALLDGDGDPVASLPTGDYSLTFSDLSQMHNFHLTGPGSVDVATDIAGSDETTVEVRLVPGTYSFVCDPHSGTMSGEFVVTG